MDHTMDSVAAEVSFRHESGLGAGFLFVALRYLPAFGLLGCQAKAVVHSGASGDASAPRNDASVTAHDSGKASRDVGAGDQDATAGEHDAGATKSDAGSERDASEPVDTSAGSDAGLPRDAGLPQDAGADAGCKGADAVLPAPRVYDTFSLVVIPDTQYAVQNCTNGYYSQMQWVADNAAARNFQYVVHVGDIQDWPSTSRSDFQWAQTGMNKLDGRVPYVIAIGNHDFDNWINGNTSNRATTRWNSFFPLSKFAEWPTFGGTYPSSNNDNSFHLFSAGGTDWMIVTLKWQPTDAEINWANGVINSHPTRQTIINTHEYSNGATNTTTGNRIWAMARKQANMAYIFSGHFTNAGRAELTGDNGNHVWNIMADYQTSASDCSPNTYLRVLELDPNERTLNVETYSPWVNNHMTDGNNKFFLANIDFLPSPTPPAKKQVRTYEAESGALGHNVGRLDGDGWSANTAADSVGHMSFGPCASDLGSGPTQAGFFLMVDNNSAEDNAVVNLDAYDSTSSQVLATRSVYRREFRGTSTYQRMSLNFDLTGRDGHAIELRVWWLDVSYVKLDKITVNIP